MRTIGCIGCGNMGGGVLRGLLRSGGYALCGHDHSRSKVDALREGASAVEWADTPAGLARACDIVIVAVKPHQMAAMLDEIRPELGPGKTVVSLAAAFSLQEMKEHAGAQCPCVRVMPSLPVIVGKGVFALCLDDPLLAEGERAELLGMFRGMGMAAVLPEDMFPAFSSLVGCGPAFLYLFMEGLQNAGIAMGFKAAAARELIAAMVEGSAALALREGEGFAGLRLRVCSPGGTTIRGVNHLERTAVPGHVADAVLEALRRDREMSAARKP
ncbi:MAG: pyrroline-5-carboxylate reductase [Mailhella sp.]|nr:pyrroline-5-carboxylate reductase [Mailhella sp.]